MTAAVDECALGRHALHGARIAVEQVRGGRIGVHDVAAHVERYDAVRGRAEDLRREVGGREGRSRRRRGFRPAARAFAGFGWRGWSCGPRHHERASFGAIAAKDLRADFHGDGLVAGGQGKLLGLAASGERRHALERPAGGIGQVIWQCAAHGAGFSVALVAKECATAAVDRCDCVAEAVAYERFGDARERAGRPKRHRLYGFLRPSFLFSRHVLGRAHPCRPLEGRGITLG